MTRALTALLLLGACDTTPGRVEVRSDALEVALPAVLYGVFAPTTLTSSVEGLLPAAILGLTERADLCATHEATLERVRDLDWEDADAVQAWWEEELRHADAAPWSIVAFLERAADVGEAWQVAEGEWAYRQATLAHRTAPYPARYTDYVAEDPIVGWDAWRALEIHVDHFAHAGDGDGLAFDLTLDELDDEKGERLEGTVRLTGEAVPCEAFASAWRGP